VKVKEHVEGRRGQKIRIYRKEEKEKKRKEDKRRKTGRVIAQAVIRRLSTTVVSG
jgi:hypothetical protein